MITEAWILMEKTALDAMWAQAHPVDPDTPIPSSARLLRQAIRGFWKDVQDSGKTYECFNVVATHQECADFNAANDVLAIYMWDQVERLDDLGLTTESGTIEFPTDPQGVFDVMRDHVTYDEDGNPTGSTPPSFDNPNWGHVFVNSSPGVQRIFAGEYTTEFTGEFL